jgi:hypothetical protein
MPFNPAGPAPQDEDDGPADYDGGWGGGDDDIDLPDAGEVSIAGRQLAGAEASTTPSWLARQAAERSDQPALAGLNGQPPAEDGQQVWRGKAWPASSGHLVQAL